jgi:NADH-quinone oxidoreductase subunit J
MLVNLKRMPEAHQDPHRQGRLGLGLAVAVLVELAAILTLEYVRPSPALADAAAQAIPVSGNTEEVGWLLYTSYLIPFEVASMLLLVAMIGAIVLARREL